MRDAGVTPVPVLLDFIYQQRLSITALTKKEFIPHCCLPGKGVLPESWVQIHGRKSTYTTPQPLVSAYFPCDKQRAEKQNRTDTMSNRQNYNNMHSEWTFLMCENLFECFKRILEWGRTVSMWASIREDLLFTLHCYRGYFQNWNG